MTGKLRDGFTLIEALAAIALAAIVMSVIISLQSTMLDVIARWSNRTIHFLDAQQYLIDTISAVTDPNTESEHTTKRHDATLHVTMSPVDTDQVANATDLYQVRATATSDQFGRKRTETLITFLYKPPVKEKKEQAA